MEGHYAGVSLELSLEVRGAGAPEGSSGGAAVATEAVGQHQRRHSVTVGG